MAESASAHAAFVNEFSAASDLAAQIPPHPSDFSQGISHTTATDNPQIEVDQDVSILRV